MTRQTRICVLTGSRAEYGLLRPLMELISRSPRFALQLAVTGAHLEEKHGYTYRSILDDGFVADALLDIGLNDNSRLGVARSTGSALSLAADHLSRLQPDLLVLLGDRYEIFSGATAALLLGIPVAHLCGGDVTEGAFDDSLRHAISKMAHLHFTTHEAARMRLIQMGENPSQVFNSGSTAIDVIESTALLNREQISAAIGFELREKTILVTIHPETVLSDSTTLCDAILWALRNFPDCGIIFTGPNADPQGAALAARIEAFVSKHSNSFFACSLGTQRYLSILGIADVVVGNSSSGIYEAPTVKTPTVNVGERQKGRPSADSVLHVPPESDAITSAIQNAITTKSFTFNSPYGGPGATQKIFDVLESTLDFQSLVKKKFYDHR